MRRERKDSGRSAKSLRTSSPSSSARGFTSSISPVPSRSQASRTLNSRQISEITASDGSERSKSQLATAPRVMPSRSANACCVRPKALRNSLVLDATDIGSTSFRGHFNRRHTKSQE